MSEAQKLVETVLHGLDTDSVIDYHVHVAGYGHGDTNCTIHPSVFHFWHPISFIKRYAFLGGFGVTDESRADQQVIERLTGLLENMKHYKLNLRLAVLAFDNVHDPITGQHLPWKTSLHVPNDYVFALALKYPQIIPVCSVHPYRNDAIEELERCFQKGARVVKWLPNSQNIDPRHEKCLKFYDKVAS